MCSLEYSEVHKWTKNPPAAILAVINHFYWQCHVWLEHSPDVSSCCHRPPVEFGHSHLSVLHLIFDSSTIIVV